MTYAKIQDSSITYPYTLADLRRDNPTTSFTQSPTAEDLAHLNVVIVEPTTPPIAPHTQTVTEGVPVYEDGVWRQTWIVTEATPEEVADREALMRAQVVLQAKALLQESDWSEHPSVRDTSVTPHLTNGPAFDAYRIALRAIVINPPLTVENWPERPDSIWA